MSELHRSPMQQAVTIRSYGKALVAAVACFVGGIAAIVLYFRAVPSLDSLKRFEAEVLGSSVVYDSRSEPRALEMRFLGRNGKYEYPISFPNYDALAALPRFSKVVVWSDVGEEYRIFQLEESGRRVIEYSAVASRIREGKRVTLYFSPALFGLAALNVWFLWKNRDFS